MLMATFLGPTIDCTMVYCQKNGHNTGAVTQFLRYIFLTKKKGDALILTSVGSFAFFLSVLSSNITIFSKCSPLISIFAF